MRIRKKHTLRELSLNFGISPSRLSGLETGRETPTPGEEKKIREWMEEQEELI
ncbi:helix-turn-helix domain-containing protein [uncultured Desulfovibrio sp.]|uniref:helix-turn-helix domain-containing protein n=1 Tax=uncultured Desulfovibrio sp. TaxID=167968 RepID=UPI00345196FB